MQKLIMCPLVEGSQREVTIDDVKIIYGELTPFTVEVGRHAKGAYKTRYTFTGAPAQAVGHYNAINIGNGYKKRLRVGGHTVCRQTS